MNGLGIVAALAAETRPLGRALPRGEALATLADGTLLVVSGMGRAAAAQGARRLLAAGAEALISWGVAGGLDPALAAGTLVLPSEVVSAEGGHFFTAGHWREQVRAALAHGQPVCCGRLLSCREVIGTAADKARAFRQTRASAVDMESLAIAEVAASQRVPFLVVRAIVDTAHDALPASLIDAAAGTGSVHIARLLGSLARTPADTLALVRLARRYRAASRTLTAVAVCGALVPHAFFRPLSAGGA